MSPVLFVLTVTRGPDQGKHARLSPEKPVTVGSGEGSELRLSDPKVLDRHCSVQMENGEVFLTNHTSNAGTYIGEQRVTRAALKPAQAFRIGDSVVQLRPVPAKNPDPEPDPLVGKAVGGYAIREVLGKGGMGTVYRATQLSLHRDVALKVLAAELAKDVSFRDLFINEARAAGQLVHPNVVQVYDAGTDGDYSYFSMELIGQGSVEEVLAERGKLPWQEAILLVLDAAHGLEYAEKKQIVHRDVKPDNLMINEDGRVKIADLGLAKRGEGRGGGEGIIGTPHFIPPEQALGKEVDTRADIYSLGATFFRMITGKTLFTGRSAKEIVLKHVKEPPPITSSVEPGVPPEVDALIAKMLAKDPAQRHQNCAELILAIEEICAHHGIKGAIIKRGVGKKVLIPIMLLLLGAIGIAVWQANKDPEYVDNPEAIRQAEMDREARKKAEEDRQKALAVATTSQTQNQYYEIRDRRNKLNETNKLDDVFDDAAKAPALKQEWLSVAAELRGFGQSENAKKYTPDESAKAIEEADGIESRLKALEASTAERAQRISEKLEEVAKLRGDLANQVEAFAADLRFAAAANLCDTIAKSDPNATEPRKDDPFREILRWRWESKDVPDVVVTGDKNTRIAGEIRKARAHFEQRRKDLLREAKERFDKAMKAADELAPATPGDQVASVLETLKRIEQHYSDPGHELKEVDELALQAGRKRAYIEGEREKQAAEDQRWDRELLFRELHQVRALSPGVLVNPLMNGDYPAARAGYERLLSNLRTEPFRNVVRERIAMLGWMEWLLGRFRADVEASLGARRDDSPLRALEIEVPAAEGGPVTRAKLVKPAGKADEISFAPGIKGDTIFAIGEFPMDWIFDRLFHHEGKPRWSDAAMQAPELRFALAAFCYETFLYDRARPLFAELRDDPVYGPAAKALFDRAGWEETARAEYVELLAALDKDLPSTALDTVKQQLLSYREKHKGTFFLLALLPSATKITPEDFTPGAPAPVPPPPGS